MTIAAIRGPVLVDDLRTFLMDVGYVNVFETQYPDAPDEIISVHERENPMALGVRGINYGARAASIAIRIRRKTIDEARAEAWAIFALLDSGADETPVILTPNRRVASRPKPPFFLEMDGKNRCTFVVKTTIITGKP